MLGNDIVTQEEFDSHLANQFEPHVKNCDATHEALEQKLAAQEKKHASLERAVTALAAVVLAIVAQILFF